MHVELDGERVFEWCYRAILTREQMAEKAGIASSKLRRVENNKGPVTLRTARKIARVLDVEPRSLGRRHLRAL